MSPRMPVQTDAAPGAIGPYSQAIVSGGLVLTAGQLGTDPATGELVEGGTAAQAEQALRNLEAVLDAAGTGFGNALKVTIFLADIADILPRGALVEIECIAQIGERGER
ncbi:MAG: hypothetical protein E6H90_16225 [Chloroflexi bacterium]|nr:MAG: hypothetical protein E6H90_16225 [Chloroflexota bacterium]